MLKKLLWAAFILSGTLTLGDPANSDGDVNQILVDKLSVVIDYLKNRHEVSRTATKEVYDYYLKISATGSDVVNRKMYSILEIEAAVLEKIQEAVSLGKAYVGCAPQKAVVDEYIEGAVTELYACLTFVKVTSGWDDFGSRIKNFVRRLVSETLLSLRSVRLCVAVVEESTEREVSTALRCMNEMRVEAERSLDEFDVLLASLSVEFREEIKRVTEKVGDCVTTVADNLRDVAVDLFRTTDACVEKVANTSMSREEVHVDVVVRDAVVRADIVLNGRADDVRARARVVPRAIDGLQKVYADAKRDVRNVVNSMREIVDSETTSGNDHCTHELERRLEAILDDALVSLPVCLEDIRRIDERHEQELSERLNTIDEHLTISLRNILECTKDVGDTSSIVDCIERETQDAQKLFSDFEDTTVGFVEGAALKIKTATVKSKICMKTSQTVVHKHTDNLFATLKQCLFTTASETHRGFDPTIADLHKAVDRAKETLREQHEKFFDVVNGFKNNEGRLFAVAHMAVALLTVIETGEMLQRKIDETKKTNFTECVKGQSEELTDLEMGHYVASLGECEKVRREFFATYEDVVTEGASNFKVVEQSVERMLSLCVLLASSEEDADEIIESIECVRSNERFGARLLRRHLELVVAVVGEYQNDVEQANDDLVECLEEELADLAESVEAFIGDIDDCVLVQINSKDLY